LAAMTLSRTDAIRITVAFGWPTRLLDTWSSTIQGP
jgi:hypothetical protein